MNRAETACTTALALLAVAGCSTRKLPQQDTGADQLFALTTDWAAFAQGPGGGPPTGKLDILFMVDNSSSMAQSQEKLAAGFNSFMSAIDALPGGTPDLHIGVISSSMGVGNDDIPGCMGAGDAGRLQIAPRGACTNTTLDPGANFIALRSDPATGERIKNYGGTLPDVFSCIALLGDAGCGFEQPFAAVRRALDPAQAPSENAGFLRPDAFLAVILISNEDDCSAHPSANLFDISQNLLSAPLGPASNFRCNEFGHLCRVGGTLQAPSRNVAATYTDCESNEHGKLESVAEFVSFLRTLKGDPAKVYLAAVAGPTDPYAVGQKPSTTALPEQWPEIAHSCTASDGSFADPAVRLAQATRVSGTHGLFASICGDSMAEPLHRIAAGLVGPLGPACLPPPAGGCNVVDRWSDGDGVRRAAIVPACADSGGEPPCWSLAEDAACASGRLVVDRGSSPVQGGLMTAVDCSGQVL